jgi:hypothetical protein
MILKLLLYSRVIAIWHKPQDRQYYGFSSKLQLINTVQK